MRAAVLLCAALMLGGCASGGLPYRDFAASAAPVAADSARLLVYRVADSPQYAVRSASLRIDDVTQESLAPGRFQALHVTPGNHRIVVDMWDVPGRCELLIEVAGGTERYFEVTPRGANAAATLPMVLVPVNSLGTLLASGAVMMGGLTVESAGKACGGAFQVQEQPSEQALSRLAALRAAREPTQLRQGSASALPSGR